jgi:hypothetical protein
MTSIIKVDTIQKANGTAPTASSLGLNVAGSVLQVQQTVYKDTFSTTVGAGFAEVTGLRTNITPTSGTSKILVRVMLTYGQSYWQVRGRILRNGVVIDSALGNQRGVRTRVTFNNIKYGGGSSISIYDMNTAIIEYLDSPGTTSSLQYSLDIGGYDPSHAVYVNRAHADTDLASYDGTPISTMTLMEIAG